MMVRVALLMALGALPATAHEFWIDPLDFAVPRDAPLLADIRVGEMLDGVRYAYNPRNFERFELVMNGRAMPVAGRAGDRPALSVTAPAEGLATVVYVTTDTILTYDGWERFRSFTDHKDFAWAQSEHRARGLPDAGFKEIYSRHAKSLIGVGDSAGRDRVVGLETEIVALENPYTGQMADGLTLRVLYGGAPQAHAQVELFSRAPDGRVEASLHRTNAKGVVTVPVRRGYEYLADHVVMRAVQPAKSGDPVWESLWASLTFAIPE